MRIAFDQEPGGRMLDTPVGIAPFDTSRLATQGATAGRAARMADANRQAETSLASLERFLDEVRFDASDAASLGEVLSAMIARGFDRLPLPGEGATLMRWHALAAVAACDLGLVKLFEGHTDALAIVAELHSPVAPEGSRWGVWAAEPPDAKVLATSTGNDGRLRLDGVKAWCSGAEAVDRKSTRLNSSHQIISYAVFCLKKKKDQHTKMSY